MGRARRGRVAERRHLFNLPQRVRALELPPHRSPRTGTQQRAPRAVERHRARNTLNSALLRLNFYGEGGN